MHRMPSTKNTTSWTGSLNGTKDSAMLKTDTTESPSTNSSVLLIGPWRGRPAGADVSDMP